MIEVSNLNSGRVSGSSAHAADLPRVLIYSNEFPQTGTAGGILLDRLFNDYPADLMRMVGTSKSPASAPLRFAHRQVWMPWGLLENSRFNRLHRTLRAYGLVALKRPGDIDALFPGFSPQVVVTVMQFGTWYDSAARYARERRLPLVTVVHDDNEIFEPVYRWAKKPQRRQDGRFYRGAVRRLCVSPEMEEEFRERYGVAGEVLYPNRSEDVQPRDPRCNLSLRSPGRLTLGFVGNPNYGYGEQLVKMLPAFRAANARLIAYGQTPHGAAEELARASDVVELRGFVPTPEEAWQGVQRDCDAMVFPYLAPPGFMEPLYRVHFPSKLPEYLALGMPIVMVGTDSATGVRWARRHPEAVLLLEADAPESWSGELRRLARDEDLRARLAAAALSAGREEFDPVSIRRDFLRVLSQAAGQQCLV